LDLNKPHPNPSPGGRGKRKIFKQSHPFSPGRRGRGMRQRNMQRNENLKRL